METPIPNPFNGAEMFNGQSHHRAAGHPGHPGPFDDEDFGPETDVDMVDDVLLSPAIAAAKALVHGATDDDFERQRQQMKEFDDPGDLDRSRDTPTPPAHEVARDASGDNLAESGGEESEEEWNYIPGNDTHNQASAQTESKQDEEDMNSQLNPNAAEFVPVSPKKLLMDDPIIASSPARGFEKSLDNIQLPSELEFTSEISQRPGDLEYSNGPKHGDDYAENFSTLHNASKEFNLPSAGSELANESIVNVNDNTQESVPFDKLAALQNMEEKITSAVIEKANIFGTNNDFCNNGFEASNIFGKVDPMTASFMGKDSSPPEIEDNFVPGTPRSTTVEAPTSPTPDEIHSTELDSPIDDFVEGTRKSPDPISTQDGIISVQERTSSSGFESESGADEVELNAVGNEGFVTEHRRSPIEDPSFKPIQTFGETNPFGAFQTPSSFAPLNELNAPLESHKETQLETPKKDFGADKHEDNVDLMQNALSFVSPRFQGESESVPFDKLESPVDIPHFAHPPNANSSFLATELPKSPEIHDEFENLSPVKLENDPHALNYKTNDNDITQELFSDDTNPDVEETSFTTEKPQVSQASHVDLDSTEGFLATESKIMQDELECEQSSKQDEDFKISSDPFETREIISNTVCLKAVDQVLAAFDDIKHEDEGTEMKHESLQEVSRDSDNEVETKEMKLELESHIASSQPTSEELNNLDDGFEVIHKEELTLDTIESEDIKNQAEQVVDLISPVKETNPFKMDDDSALTDLVTEEKESSVQSQKRVNNDLFSAVDQFSASVNEDLIPSVNYNQLSSSLEPHSHFEPEATKKVSYQTLTPANEPQITKSESYITGEKEESKSATLEEIATEIKEPIQTDFPVDEKESVTEKEEIPASATTEVEKTIVESAQKIEPVQSTVVTETLITALEETSEVPSAATTEVPSSAGTPPPTPAPGHDDSKELQDTPKTDILVAAVAAAGAVAAGSAILAEKEAKKTKDVTTKKPAAGAKKTPDITTKPSVKSTTTKTLAAKPAMTKTTTTTITSTTTKAASTAPKPSLLNNKPASAKPSATSAAPKKSPAVSAPKPAPPKSAVPAAKQTTIRQQVVPKQLPINKTTPSTLKSPTKPLTPTSKPTTPTMPKSPSVKSDTIKSPSKPGVKSPLPNKTLAPKSTTEKKPLTNGDVKHLPKKAEVPKKPTTTTMRSTLTKSAPPTKAAAPKLSSTIDTAKPKPASTLAQKPSITAAKRPSTAPSGRTLNGKETVSKQVPSSKPALNGKSAPAKPGGIKKTDPKLNAANAGKKPPPIKKPEELKKEEEKPTAEQIQEAAVTTTNGFTDHNEEEKSLKIEDLAPMTVETVN